MKVEDLKKLLQSEEVLSNSDLKEDLESLFNKNRDVSDNLSIYPLNISVDTYKYLLENHNLNLRLFFESIIQCEPGEKYNQLLDLALSKKVDFSSIYSLPSSISIADLEKCFDHGLTLTRAATLVLGCNHNSSDNINIELQEKLVKYLFEKQANFSDVYSVPGYFSEEVYELMLENGLKADSLFREVIKLEPGEKHDQLLDLALSRKVDFYSIYPLPSSISIADLEKCFDHGLTLTRAATLVLGCNHNSSDNIKIELQEKLVKYLLEKQANFSDVYSVPGYFSEEVYELMLEKGLKVDSLFSRAIELEPGEKHDQLLDLALSKKVDFSSIYLSLPSSISDSDLEKCFKHGLTIEILIRSIFRELEKAYNLDSIEYNQAKLTERQIEILNKAKNNDTDINKVFTESIESFYRLTDFDGKLHIIPEKILEVLLKNYALDSNLILIYGIYNKVTDIVKFAIENNADVNCVIPNQNISLFVKALFNQNIEGVNLLIEYGAKLEISIEHYIGVIKSSSFNFAAQIINKLPNLYTNDQLYEIFRSYGSSEAQIRDFLDLYDLIKEYVSAKEGNSTSISQIEMGILDGNVLLDKIIEYKEATLTNKYGYSLLHLSIIAGQYKLASKLVKDGVDINTKNHNNITPLQLLVSKKDVNLVELAEAVLEKADNIDISLGSGEILTDILIQNKDLEERVVELTNDSLFNLFKKEADLFSPSKDLSKTNIAISHGDNFWSTGIWSTARIISKNYPDVKIYLVRSDTLEKGGEAFLKQFDAVINPGAGDTYPKIDEFTKADCPFNMNLEKHYQNMLEFTHNHNIPYLGMCAGAQHFAMYHGGSLRPLKGYNKGQHQVKYIEGTYAHFMALTKAQQQEALQNCELPEIKFEGYTAHNYAAINEKLGNNMELGAVSEDNVAMSYAHSNGIRYATQFHPERFYDNLDDANTTNQKAWINNFVELAQMHHEFRMNGAKHPTEYFAEVKLRLNECLVEPTCLAEDSLAAYQDLYS